jgi:GT2 family glycosyltransferase
MARVLVAMIVYNGRAFVPRAVESVSRLEKLSSHTVDVLVLDDCSPDPLWSEELETLCAQHGVGYYRSPRNLGIPRNMNLGLLRAESENYDHVVILNSDVIVPANMADQLVAAAESARSAGKKVASVTAWSNNASIFSLPNDDADRFLSNQIVVDQVSDALTREFAGECYELPVGMGFCLSVSREAIDEIGLFDPVFGRGYCEEVDWCCRASAAGWSHVLATTTYAYHMGSATNRLAGLLQPGEQTVHTNEAIIDHRYPDYRNRVEAWESSGGIETAVSRGLSRLVREEAKRHGYLVDATWLRRQPVDAGDQRVRIALNPDGDAPLVEASGGGWRCAIALPDDAILPGIAAFLDCAPSEVRLLDRGSIATQLQADAIASGVPLRQLQRYPERV